jgi:hypothetical protein
MPVCRTPHSAALALALLLGGCAATAGDKFNPNPDAAAATTAGVTASAAAVRAFGHLCGRMEEAEVRRRAAAYGFAPMNPNRLPPAVTRGGEVRMMARPGPARRRRC